MKTIALVFLMLALPAVAQTAKPPGSPPETVYSYSQRTRDNELSQRFLHSMMRPSTSLEGEFAKWKRPVCPQVTGLTFPDAYFLEHRISEIARQMGAPLDQKSTCLPNVVILVTPQPQAVLDVLKVNHPRLFAAAPRGELKMHYPIQAWYFSVVRDYNGAFLPDMAWTEYAFEVPLIAGYNTRLYTGIQPEMRVALMLVDAAAIRSVPLESLADYLALMSLSQAPASGNCQPAPSIANLFLSGCEAGFRTTGISDVDRAMLTSLYQTPDEPERLQLTRMLTNMRRNLEAGGK